jgi:hypothetical protein
VHGLLAIAVVRLGLTLSVGPEWDSNANRAEIVTRGETPDTPISSFLLRTMAQGTLSWRQGINLVRASADLGGKIYFNKDVFDQDVLAFRAGGEDRLRVARFLHLALAGDYYDAWQLPVTPYRHRDFRSGAVVGRVHFVDPLGEVTLAGGYRGFVYKPDPEFDFQAAQASASAFTRVRFGRDEDHEIDLAASYHLERRLFNGPVDTFNNDNCGDTSDRQRKCLGIPAGAETRADWFHEGGLDLTYVGTVLASVGYAAQLNLSNSFGQSLLRNIITFKLGYRLPWNLYATVKAQLFVTQYFDPVLLDRLINTQSQAFITIEDENRNNVIVDLERPIGRTGLAVLARYSVFTNEISPNKEVKFLRQVVYLGLTYRLGPR